MGRTGVVLGAGGLVGQAYQSGVLSALETDLGWDPRSADVIVGTSAGSLTGAALRLDMPALDIAGWTLGQTTGAGLLSGLDLARTRIPAPSAHMALQRWHFPSGRALAAGLRRPMQFRALPMLSTMLPAGSHSLVELVDEAVSASLSDDWPDGFRVCASRRSDGIRTVFGSPGASRATLTEAVAASCAIPGFMAPVRIGGTEYVDGGTWSPTNADVLADEDLDLILVISPMSGRSWGWDRGMRAWAHRRLRSELAVLRASGTDVVCFEPSSHTIGEMGLNLMAQHRSGAVLRAAYFETGRRVGDPVIRERLGSIVEDARRIPQPA